MNKKIKKIISLTMAFTVLLGVSSTAFSMTVTNAKEEVVYVLLNEDGASKSVYVVNSYENETGELVDYGKYDSVRNLTTEDKLKNEAGKVTGTISSGKFYYEGKMGNVEIPWDIDIYYTLDGKPIIAKDLAGKSGALEIGMHISQNTKANPSFYENYALQASVVLDTNRCQNIVADGATIANIGENKNISYTLLPQKDRVYKITANVKNFEMGAISINGVPFNMNFNVDGIDKMTSGLSDLTYGIAKLDDGANKLQKGATELQEGMNQLNSKSSVLSYGSSEVLNAINQINKAIASVKNLTSATGGIVKLETASKEYSSKINELANKYSVLPKSSQDIYEGIKNSNSGLTKITKEDEAIEKLMDKLSAMNDPSVNSLINAYKTKMEGVSAVTAGINKLQSQYEIFNNAISETAEATKSLSEGYSQIHKGIENINISINGLSELSEAVNTLAIKYAQLNNGVIEYTEGYNKIVSGYSTIYSGIIDLTKGTTELRNGTKDIDKEINEKVNSALSEFKGKDFSPVSFVSTQNTNVASVQFVMKTDAIKIPEQEKKIDEQPKKLSFWQKLLALF